MQMLVAGLIALFGLGGVAFLRQRQKAREAPTPPPAPLPTVVVPVPVPPGPSPEQEAERQKALEEAEKKRKEAEKTVEDRQRKDAPVLADKPDDINERLKEIGRKARGEEP